MRCLWDSLSSKNLNCFSVILGDSFNMPLDWSWLLGSTAIRNNLVAAKSLARIGRNWIELFSVKVIPKAASTATEFLKWKNTAKIQFVINEYSFPTYKKYSWRRSLRISWRKVPEGEERAHSHVHMRGEEGSRSLSLSPAKSVPLLTRDSFT